MQFSVSRFNTNQDFEPVTANHFEDLSQHILWYNYSMGVFRNNDRKNKNFISAEAVALDFDGGLTLAEAKLRFAQYKHIIATTRSHQKNKNGVVTDRFRVILQLSSKITSVDDYRATISHLIRQNPEADVACKDPARMYYPSVLIVSTRWDGKTLDVVKAKLREAKEPIVRSTDLRGKLLRQTLEFLLIGAPAGERHHRLYASAKDMQGQGYTIDEIIASVSDMIKRTGNWEHPSLTDKCIKTIEDAFTEESNDEQRVAKAPFNFKAIGDLYKQDIKVDWLVDELLIAGGLSLIAARPKSGKSTIVRQLAKSVCRGEKFFNRTVRKGKVAYLALEEHPAMLQQQFKKIGVTDTDNILLHVGPVYSTDATEELIVFLKDYDAQLVIIDTLALFVGLDDINSYDKVNKAMAKVRKIARETNAHVLLVHHTNKNDVTDVNSILGSQAFLGAVDTAVIINVINDRRFLTSVGRGLTNFENDEILFNKKDESYKIKMEVKSEF